MRTGDVDKAFADGRARVRARIPHPEGAAPPVRAVRLDRRLQGQAAHALHRLAGPVLRAHRDRAPARLAGEPRPHQGAVPRRRLWRQALHQARGAGHRAVDDRQAAGEGRAAVRGDVLHHHPPPHDVPHQERGRRATAGITARRCEVYWNGGAYADIGPRVAQKSGFTAAGPLRDRATCRSIPTRSTPTSRRPARCAASACRSWCGPTNATPT